MSAREMGSHPVPEATWLRWQNLKASLLAGLLDSQIDKALTLNKDRFKVVALLVSCTQPTESLNDPQLPEKIPSE